jgi:hypothetical protein
MTTQTVTISVEVASRVLGYLRAAKLLWEGTQRDAVIVAESSLYDALLKQDWLVDTTVSIPLDAATSIRDRLCNFELEFIKLGTRRRIAEVRVALDELINDPKLMVGVVRGHDGR